MTYVLRKEVPIRHQRYIKYRAARRAGRHTSTKHYFISR